MISIRPILFLTLFLSFLLSPFLSFSLSPSLSLQSRLNDENAKLAREQERFQRSQREGDSLLVCVWLIDWLIV